MLCAGLLLAPFLAVVVLVLLGRIEASRQTAIDVDWAVRAHSRALDLLKESSDVAGLGKLLGLE